MDPYKISTAVLSAVLVAIGIAFLMKNRLPMATPTGSFFGLKEFSYVMILFLPHILVVFGFVADALSQDFRYSIPSLAGFAGLLLNWVFGSLMKRATSPSPLVGGSYESGCSVPGFEWLASSHSSAPLVVTFTIMSYYLLDLWQNSGFVSSIPAIIATAALSVSQLVILRSNGCFDFSSPSTLFAVSAAIGLLVGGSVYGVVQAVDRSRLPTTVYARESQTEAVTSTTTPPPVQKPTGGGCSNGKCEAPSDEDQFVCDTYVNGMPVSV